MAVVVQVRTRSNRFRSGIAIAAVSCSFAVPVCVSSFVVSSSNEPPVLVSVDVVLLWFCSQSDDVLTPSLKISPAPTSAPSSNARDELTPCDNEFCVAIDTVSPVEWPVVVV